MLSELVKSLYESHYDKFFSLSVRALSSIRSLPPDLLVNSNSQETYLHSSRLFQAHTLLYIREMRILAYIWLLKSYGGLMLDNIALTFGVTVEYIFTCVSRLIN